jgi:hypothetical protein
MLTCRLQRPLVCGFAGDKWKERDEAAERVYISQRESTVQLS